MRRSSDWGTISGLSFIGIIFLLTSFALYLSGEAGSNLGYMFMYQRKFDFWIWMEVIHDNRCFSISGCFAVPFVLLIAAGGYMHWWREGCITSYIISTLFLLAVCYFIFCSEVSSFNFMKIIQLPPQEYLDSLPDVIKWIDNNPDKWRLGLILSH